MTVGHYFQFLVRKYGVLTLAGIALLLVALSCLIFLTVPELKKREHLSAESENLSANRKFFVNEADATLSEANIFYNSLPAYADMENKLNLIFEAAEKNGLDVEQVEYKLETYSTGRLDRYHILMPLSGGYINIRKFINLAMQTNPSLSLDHLSFNRETTADTFVDVNLDLSLYLLADQK